MSDKTATEELPYPTSSDYVREFPAIFEQFAKKVDTLIHGLKTSGGGASGGASGGGSKVQALRNMVGQVNTDSSGSYRETVTFTYNPAFTSTPKIFISATSRIKGNLPLILEQFSITSNTATSCNVQLTFAGAANQNYGYIIVQLLAVQS